MFIARRTDPDNRFEELRLWADRVISLGNQGSLHARRQALGIVQDKAVVRKLFDTLGPRFKDRPGGYTRIIKIGWRHGDAAPISLVELVAGTVATESGSGSEKKLSRRRRRAAAQEAPPRKKRRGEGLLKKRQPEFIIKKLHGSRT